MNHPLLLSLLATACCILSSTTDAFTATPYVRPAHQLSLRNKPIPVANANHRTHFHRQIKPTQPLFQSTSTPNNSSDGIETNTKRVTVPGLSAIRASIRATTGLSLSAMRTTLRTLTGVSVSGTVKKLIGLLPPWFRYFLQPFLIMYYVPLTILKGLIGTSPTAKSDARKAHESLVDYWKQAIQLAESKNADWPLHVMDDGNIKYDLQDDRMNDAIVEAIEMKHRIEDSS